MNTRLCCSAATLILTAIAGGVPGSTFAAPMPKPEWVLCDGKNLSAWRENGEWIVAQAVSLDPADDQKFAIASGEGIMVNGRKGRTVNLVSREEFGDVEAHVEFCVPKKSNSGVYFMGRYEVQIYDSFGVQKDKYPGIECGGIYPRWKQERKQFEGHSPRLNASKPPGAWQTFEVVFRAPRFGPDGKKTANATFVKVVHNGQVVHENVEVTGPTRGATFDDEKPAGPLMLQGNHGPVAYRNLRIKTVKLDPGEIP